MSSGKPTSRDWRAQPPAQSLYAREWRGSAAGGPPRFSRSFKLRALVLTISVILGVIVFLLALVGGGVPATQIVAFGIGAYGGRANPQGNMPINPFGEQDAHAFGPLTERNPAQFPEVRQEDNALSGAQFLTFLQQEADSPAVAGRNLVVFGTLHALVQPSGAIELFAIDATPDSPGSSSGAMVPLDEVVSRLQACPARRVLLALDTARLDSDWRLGILANDVAEQIASQWPAQSLGVPSPTGGERRTVAILLGAAPGQQSRIAEGQSAFARYLIEGLTGAADGWRVSGSDTGSGNSQEQGNGPRDQRVTLHELKAFVRHHVLDWSMVHAGARQHVELYGDTTDWEVAVVSPPAAPPSGKKQAAKKADDEKADDEGVGVDSKKEKAEGSQVADKDAGEKAGDAGAKTSDGEPSSAAPSPPPTPAVPEIKWDVRLAELRKIRDDGWKPRSNGDDPAGIPSQVPLAWRTFESQLALTSSLERGGLAELAPRAVQQADATYKRIQARLASPAGLAPESESHRRLLLELGFAPASLPTKEALEAAEKFLQLLAADLAKPPANPASPAIATAVPPAQPAVAIPEPEPTLLVSLLQRQLLDDPKPANWAQIKQISDRLVETGRWPTTPQSQLIREVLTAETPSGDEGAAVGTGNALARLFALQERFRQVAVRHPESLPMVRQKVGEGLRAVTAAHRWLLATGPGRPELTEWLERAEQCAAEAEGETRQYADAVETWSTLLIELPALAAWVATRADDDQRQVDWLRLRQLARLWVDHERDDRWESVSLAELWPEKPARLTDLERHLLVQFIDAQRLKSLLLDSGNDGGQPSDRRTTADKLSQVARVAAAHRRDLQDELARSMPRLGTASAPTPALHREAERLLAQPWLTSDNRRQMTGILQLVPRGDPVRDRPADTGALWQGFWGIAALSLLANDDEGTAPLWKDWERLVELSRPVSSGAPGGSNPEATQGPGRAERDVLRKRRAELGRAIRQRWSALQGRAQSVAATSGLPACYLAAATLDPTLIPASDPDQRIRSEQQAHFAGWLALFADDWRVRGLATTGGESGYMTLAARAEGLAQELGLKPAPAKLWSSPRFEEVPRPAFSPNREGRIELAVADGDTPRPALQVNLSGPRVRLLEQTSGTILNRGVIRPFPASGKWPVTVRLDDDVETVQPLLVVLTEDDGFPLDFRRILLYPPFDPSEWRVEFTDAATGAPVESVPLSRMRGMKMFLPPAATVGLQAHLVRPANDSTPSASITLYQLTESGRLPLSAKIDLKLEAGKPRTPLVFDLPAPAPAASAGTAAPAAAASTAPLADLARGWLFEITPESQAPLEYAVRPTFWSAAKFLHEPRPVIRDGRFTLELERLAASADDVLLPAKVPVELVLPPALQKTLTDYTLGGPVGPGQKLTLSFALPKDWSDRVRDRDWTLSLDAAGLPHAYRWTIDPQSNIATVTGQPPQLGIRLILPPDDPKALPRLEPIVLKGKEPLHLQFQVDATELDRTDETSGGWNLSYQVVRELDSRVEATPLRHSWRLFSSLERRVLLGAVKAGVWSLRTSAGDYELIEPASEIRGLSGRFLVQAELTRSAAPSDPLARATMRFAIDNDDPPSLEVKALSKEPQSTEKDLPLRIEASDPESGIQHLAYGFDVNGDKVLQQGETLEEKTLVGLDNPQFSWPILIIKAKLPKIEKEAEVRTLLVQARNGVGTVLSKEHSVLLRKPPPPPVPKTATTGTLIVKLKLNRGAKATIQITGPDTRFEETSAGTVTFSEVKAGQYTIAAKVNYAVIGQKEAGEAKVDVKVGETTTVSVPLLGVK